MSLASSYDDYDENYGENFSMNETQYEVSFEKNESFLTISYQECKIGVAFYRFGSPKIELLHEMYEFEDFTVIRKVLYRFSPTNVVVSSKCESKLFYLLKKYSNLCQETISSDNSSIQISTDNIDQNSNNQDMSNLKERTGQDFDSFPIEGDSTLNNLNNRFKLHIVSSNLFHYDQCKSRILSINFPQISTLNDNTERYIYMTSYIDFFQVNTIRSLGVLLYFIEKQLLVQKSTLVNNVHFNSLSDFVYFDLEYFVTMDQLTYEALDIFQNEWHPSTSKKGLAKKESFTLYGIFNSCASKIGSIYLKKLFLQPITDANLLEERYEIIDFFIKPSNSNLKETIYHFLKNIKDISATINRFRSMNFKISDFRLLQQTVISVISIRNLVSNNVMFGSNLNIDKLKIFKKISQQFTTDLEEIYECLEKAIDLEKSKDDGKIIIKKGIDDQLDKMKFYFNKLPDILRIVITKEDFVNELIQKYNIHITIIYLPQLGFLLKLLLIEAQKVKEIDKYGFDLIFCANDSAYYKNPKTIEFDKIFGDILSEINDKTQQVLGLIKDFIMKRINTLSMAIDFCAFLDAMISMAQTAIELDFIRPNLTCHGTIKIHEGRHPLYELITNSFVPNDYYSDNQLCKTLVVFGLNSCGKTVYLKQVCLIVYLAHIGSFVPAKLAEIQIVDKIFTRIRTPESISTQLSSFKHDLNQIIAATKYAKRRSLVVIDLFGKSTLHTDGFALLEACLNYWIQNENGPHLVISTQFNMVSKLIYQNKVQCYSFEIATRNFKLKPYKKNDDETLIGHAAPELVDINNIVENDQNKAQLISKLESKQQRYLELADLILKNHSLESINKFIRELNSIDD